YNVTPEAIPYMVFEFIAGEHLGARIARGKLEWSEAQPLLKQMVDALSTAHGRNVVHRDLKPENVMLCGNGRVKVVDFGVAKLRDNLDVTSAGAWVGTVAYMAPEQLTGGRIDSRTDQFALAGIVFEMLSGQMAFGSDEGTTAISHRILHARRPFLSG